MAHVAGGVRMNVLPAEVKADLNILQDGHGAEWAHHLVRAGDAGFHQAKDL